MLDLPFSVSAGGDSLILNLEDLRRKSRYTVTGSRVHVTAGTRRDPPWSGGYAAWPALIGRDRRYTCIANYFDVHFPIGVRRGVSKGAEDGRRPQAACPVGRPPLKRPYGCFSGGPPAGHRRVRHGGPKRYFRESMATPCHTSMHFPTAGQRVFMSRQNVINRITNSSTVVILAG
jgi:hypothetical protein